MCIGASPLFGAVGTAASFNHAMAQAAVAQQQARARRQAMNGPMRDRGLWPFAVFYVTQQGNKEWAIAHSLKDFDRIKDVARWRTYLGEQWDIETAEANIAKWYLKHEQ